MDRLLDDERKKAFIKWLFIDPMDLDILGPPDDEDDDEDDDDWCEVCKGPCQGH